MSDINRQILNLAWPAIATNITTPLLALIDVAIVGHINGGDLIAAVAVGGTLFNIMYWLFGFLRMGTSGMTAQAYGAGDKAEQRHIWLRGCTIALTGGLLLTLAPFVGDSAIRLIDNGPTSGLALRYFSLAIIGAPGVLVTFVVSGWLLGMQRSRPIMWIALSTNLLNIALSCLLVFGFRLGLDGVALGTAISQLAGAVTGVWVVFRVIRKTGNKGLPSSVFKNRTRLTVIFRKDDWKRIFRVNTDIFFRTLCLATVTLWFTHEGARFGTEILAANSLLTQFFMIFSYFMDGFAFGGEALAGKYFGAKDISNLRRTVRALFVWGIFTSLLFTVIYFFAGEWFLNVLTNDTRIVDVASDFKFWAVTIPFMGFSAFTWDGILIGMTHTRVLLASMLTAMIIFFAVYYVGIFFTRAGIINIEVTSSTNNHILWLAFVVYLGVRGLISTVLYKKVQPPCR